MGVSVERGKSKRLGGTPTQARRRWVLTFPCLHTGGSANRSICAESRAPEGYWSALV